MTTVKIKTADLIGAALDWAVAKCERLKPPEEIACPECRGEGAMTYYGMATIYEGCECKTCKGHCLVTMPKGHRWWANYSTDWSEGGPITQHRKINIHYCCYLSDRNGLYIHAEMETHLYHGYWYGDHEQPLIAAMRCYCRSKLGDEIDIPQELAQ